MKTAWVVVALVIIVGSTVFLLSYYQSQPEPGEPVPHRAPLACAACGKAYIGMIGGQPGECPYCGEEAVWRAVQCLNCGAIIPNVGGPSYSGESSLRCPKCGGTRFTPEVPPDAFEEP
jgi:DNA-directed RNA polymerase subunit RPC12/RpoP